MTYTRFKNLRGKPDYSEEFNCIWKNYKLACENNNSEGGSKQHAWFCMLQRLDSGHDIFQIELVLKAYVLKKTKVGFKLAHLSTVLNEQELINQYLDEIEDEEKKIQSARIEGFENRFK